MRTQLDSPGYVPLAIAVLLAAGWADRRAGRAARLPGPHAVPAWEDGFAAPPAWMPFGDPATQVTAGGACGDAAAAMQLAVRPACAAAAGGGAVAAHPAPAAAAAVILALAVLLLLAVAVFGSA